MAKGRWSKLLWIAALVPLFGATVLPTQLRALVCRVTGVLMDEKACCPAGDQTQAASVSRLFDQGCCVVRTVDLPKLLSDHQADGPIRWDGQPLVFAGAAELTRPDAVGLPSPRVRPPPLGPPLRFLKRSFLI